MRMNLRPRRKLVLMVLVGLCGLGILLPAPRAVDFPREGNPAIANGVAEPFAGRWKLGWPEGEGMINGEPDVSCSAPIELVPLENENLLHRSPSGAEVQFELLEFSGRTTWLPQWGESTIAVWIDDNEFFAYSVDIATGKARWDNPMAYRRCTD